MKNIFQENSDGTGWVQEIRVYNRFGYAVYEIFALNFIKIYQITWDVFQDTKLIATAKTIWIALLSYGPQWLRRPDVGQWSRIRHDLEPNWNAILDFPTRTWVVHSSVPRPEDWDCDRPNRGYFPLPLFHWARLILKYIFHKILKRNAPKLWKSCVFCLTAI